MKVIIDFDWIKPDQIKPDEFEIVSAWIKLNRMSLEHYQLGSDQIKLIWNSISLDQIKLN
jgi:hypothetical protein